MVDNNTEHTINPTLGIVLKALRKAKGCTLKEAAGDSFSYAHLSNFEHGRTELSAQLFLNLLENINVSIIEFQHFYDNYLRSHNNRPFSNKDISLAYMSGNITRLENILYHLESRNDKIKSKKSKLEIIRIKSIISLIDPTRPLLNNDTFFLKSYLMQLNEWGKYDIALLGQTYTNFDLGTLSILTDKMLNPSQITINLESNQHALIQTVLNVMTYFTENSQFDKVAKLINYLEKMNIHEYYMFEKLIFIYHISALDYKLGDKSALSIMERCQEILEFCGCLDNANILAKEISKLKKNRET
jgi:HTH-type transcriptional regulator, SHP2-responsive activator